jgi:hypothetical protein
VHNRFFGGDIHIAGLLTATDILEQIAAFPQRQSIVYIPRICLRDGALFLDDITLTEARALSGLDLRAVGNSPRDLAVALGLLQSARPQRASGLRSHWIMEENVVADT